MAGSLLLCLQLVTASVGTARTPTDPGRCPVRTPSQGYCDTHTIPAPGIYTPRAHPRLAFLPPQSENPSVCGSQLKGLQYHHTLPGDPLQATVTLKLRPDFV